MSLIQRPAGQFHFGGEKEELYREKCYSYLASEK